MVDAFALLLFHGATAFLSALGNPYLDADRARQELHAARLRADFAAGTGILPDRGRAADAGEPHRTRGEPSRRIERRRTGACPSHGLGRDVGRPRERGRRRHARGLDGQEDRQVEVQAPQTQGDP
jgi:hypothetical protein